MTRPTVSRRIHGVCFRDADQSLCARAWSLRHTSPFWAAWVAVFGRAHCERSWRFYHGKDV
jgi:hypothetical protein